jgi:uncharacterized protein (DUF58 family)
MARYPEAVYSNDFQQERVADVAVVLDGRERADLHAPGRSLFEYSVIAAGSLASALLRDGNRVGLLVYSQYLQWTMPGYGKIQRERILHVGSRGQSDLDGLQHLPTRLFPPESRCWAVLSRRRPSLCPRGRGYQVQIPTWSSRSRPRRGTLFRPRHSAAAECQAERSAPWRLRRAGVQVIEWDVRLPFDQAMLGAFRRLQGAGIHP